MNNTENKSTACSHSPILLNAPNCPHRSIVISSATPDSINTHILIFKSIVIVIFVKIIHCWLIAFFKGDWIY